MPHILHRILGEEVVTYPRVFGSGANYSRIFGKCVSFTRICQGVLYILGFGRGVRFLRFWQGW